MEIVFLINDDLYSCHSLVAVEDFCLYCHVIKVTVSKAKTYQCITCILFVKHNIEKKTHIRIGLKIVIHNFVCWSLLAPYISGMARATKSNFEYMI